LPLGSGAFNFFLAQCSVVSMTSSAVVASRPSGVGSYNEINLAPLGLSVLLPLRHLTELDLCYSLLPEQCSSLEQLTGLRRLRVMRPSCLSAYDLRHLASLEQLTGPG